MVVFKLYNTADITNKKGGIPNVDLPALTCQFTEQDIVNWIHKYNENLTMSIIPQENWTYRVKGDFNDYTIIITDDTKLIPKLNKSSLKYLNKFVLNL